MNTSVVAANPVSHRTDLLALLLREGGLDEPRFVALDRALGGLLSRCAAEEEFTGKEGQALSLHSHGKAGPQRILLVGLGREKDADRTLEQIRNAAARAVRAAKSAGAKQLSVSWPAGATTFAAEAQAAAEGAALGAYVFDRYKKEKKRLKLARVELLSAAKPAAAVVEAARYGVAVAHAVNAARDLVNEPAGRITPRALASAAREVARQHGLRCQVLGRRQIEKLGMHLFLAVAQGSALEPQLVRLSWEPKRSSARPVALVGKAITFDSAGSRSRRRRAWRT